jgi:hypothetical protein
VKTSEFLKVVKTVIDTPEKWERFSRDKWFYQIPLQLIPNKQIGEEYNLLTHTIRINIFEVDGLTHGGVSVKIHNTRGSTHAEVMAMWDIAIDLAEKDETA